MRRAIAEKMKVRAGDLVRAFVRLPSGMEEDGRIGIWTKSGDDEYSPYVPDAIIETLMDGKPIMVTPMMIRLHSARRSYTFEFTADRQMDIRIVQEIDIEADKSVKGRITHYGKTQQALRRHFRNAVRKLRSFAGSHFRP